MASKGTNHICRNKKCPNGVNGEPKHYYACDYCDKTKQWRSVACSIECYDEYVKQVLEERAKNREVSMLPNRTDKTESEVKQLMEAPVEKVLEDTKEELKEYIEDGKSISEAITIINEEIDAESTVEADVENVDKAIEKTEKLTETKATYTYNKKKKKNQI